MPAPQVVVDGSEVDMDLLWVEHRTCGYSADGGANLGVLPTVVAADEAVTLTASSNFDAHYTVGRQGDGSATSDAVPFSSDVSVDVPDSGCRRLEVELHDGDLRGRFVSLLEASDQTCTSAAP